MQKKIIMLVIKRLTLVISCLLIVGCGRDSFDGIVSDYMLEDAVGRWSCTYSEDIAGESRSLGGRSMLVIGSPTYRFPKDSDWSNEWVPVTEVRGVDERVLVTPEDYLHDPKVTSNFVAEMLDGELLQISNDYRTAKGEKMNMQLRLKFLDRRHMRGVMEYNYSNALGRSESITMQYPTCRFDEGFVAAAAQETEQQIRAVDCVAADLEGDWLYAGYSESLDEEVTALKEPSSYWFVGDTVHFTDDGVGQTYAYTLESGLISIQAPATQHLDIVSCEADHLVWRSHFSGLYMHLERVD